MGDEAGEFTLDFNGSYWPKGHKNCFKPIQLTRSLVVLAHAPTVGPPPPPEAATTTPTTPTPTPTPPAGVSCNGTANPANPLAGAGETALAALMLGCLWTLSRRNKNRK